ncbi:hypothetical protein Bca4012_009794 [Brassica carinata]|uniref:Uncharacterized protein n=1 Tax=Brassica carinata TaxID=52824 RepID=A0A8X7RZV5_BRACI|nr:hypothetical protein Bca52824_035025 [Brassica carinata]
MSPSLMVEPRPRLRGGSSITDSYSTPLLSPSPSPSPSPAPRRLVTLLELSHQKKKKAKSLPNLPLRLQFFPIIIAAAYKIPILLGGLLLDPHRIGSRVWGTLFGYCKGRVSLSIQESPRCLPSLLVKLAMQQ